MLIEVKSYAISNKIICFTKYYPQFAANFLVVTLLKTFTIYPYKLFSEKSIPDHRHETTIITIFGCNYYSTISRSTSDIVTKSRIEEILPSFVKAGTDNPLFLIFLVSSMFRPSIVVFISLGYTGS